MNEESKNEILEELKRIKYLTTLILITKDLELNDEQKIKTLNLCGYTQTEIAELLRINQSTVSRRLKPKAKA